MNKFRSVFKKKEENLGDCKVDGPTYAENKNATVHKSAQIRRDAETSSNYWKIR